jgi:hypothetical protein
VFAQADNKVEEMKRHLEQTVASSSESSRLTAEQRADMRILDMQKLMAGAIDEVRDDVERGEMFAYKQQTQQAQSMLEDRLVTANDLLDSERAARLKAENSARQTSSVLQRATLMISQLKRQLANAEAGSAVTDQRVQAAQESANAANLRLQESQKREIEATLQVDVIRREANARVTPCSAQAEQGISMADHTKGLGDTSRAATIQGDIRLLCQFIFNLACTILTTSATRRRRRCCTDEDTKRKTNRSIRTAGRAKSYKLQEGG